MRQRNWIALLAALVSVTSARAQEKHCQLQSLGEMPATYERGVVITEGQIDGKPVRLIVDTGGFGTLLFQGEAEKLGLVLRRTSATAYGVGGAVQIYSARVKEFRLGALAEQNADLVVAAGRVGGGVQGLVGARFLLQADLEIDLPHGKIRFFKPKDCEGDQVVYWGEAYAVAPMIPTPDDRIVVEVKVNGARVIAQMDTGASVSALTPAGAALAGVTLKSTGVVSQGQTSGLGLQTVQQYADVFPSFSFGEETIHNATLRVADLFARAKEKQINDLIATPISDQPQMLLGADFFRAHRVFIAREQHKVYVSYEGGPVFRPEEAPPGAKP